MRVISGSRDDMIVGDFVVFVQVHIYFQDSINNFLSSKQNRSKIFCYVKSIFFIFSNEIDLCDDF